MVGEGPRAIVMIYDIFGFAPAQTRHSAGRKRPGVQGVRRIPLRSCAALELILAVL